MTRLSDALKKAADSTDTPPAITPQPLTPPAATGWQFAPVETMHVPDEPLDPPLHAVPPAVDSDATHGQPPVFAPAADTRRRIEPAAAAKVAPIVVGAADRNKLIIGEGVDGALVEQYRHLAAVMHHAQKASNIRSIMVTSALPAEGKTLTATNLALTLSESYQRRVLLIDADLRRPRIKDMFALPDGEGLTDSLAIPRDGRLPVHQVTPTLWVLTAGRVLPDPMSLLVSPAMKQLLEDAKESFDWVVVDTPPIAILSDANLLAAMIDTTLLVVSAESTPYPMVQRAAAAVGTNRILGVVLNRAENTSLPSNYYRSNGYQQGLPTPEQRRWFGWLRKRRSAPSASA
jgi:protein-tyrosine kinase